MSALERVVVATRALSHALEDAVARADAADLAVKHAAANLRAPCALLWLAVGAGKTLHLAAAYGDPGLIAAAPRSGDVVDLQATLERQAYVGVTVRSAHDVHGLLAVRRRRRRFSGHDALVLSSLADALAMRLVHLQAMERGTRSERAITDEQLRTTYEAIACGVTVWSPDGTLLQFNQAAEEMMGRPLEPEVGQPLMDLVRVVRSDGTQAPAQERRVLTAARTGKPIRDYTSTVTRADGEPRFLQMNAVPVLESDGQVSRVVCSFFDITERKRAEDLLAHQAHHDALTGLPNRKLLIDRLEKAVEQADVTRAPVALLLIDLDGFKQVNDTRGHQAGDQLLQAVAARWRSSLRSGDLLARLGGDEFAVLVENSDRSGAEVVERTLHERLDGYFWVDGAQVTVGASIGLAVYPHDAISAEELLKHADVDMYRDKKRRKKRSVPPRFQGDGRASAA